MGLDEIVLCATREEVRKVVGDSVLRDTVYDPGWFFNQPLEALNKLVHADKPLWSVRNHCETDEGLKQIIPYVTISHIAEMPTGDGDDDYFRFFMTYFRTQKSGEGRLRGKRSLGFGGHISHPETIMQALYREINEELEIHNAPYDLNFLGFVNNESDAVGRVHIGALFDMNFPESRLPVLKDDAAEGAVWVREDLLKDMREEFEIWSQLVIDNLPSS